MFSDIELVGMGTFLVVFLITWGVGFFLYLRASGDERRTQARLRELSDTYAASDRQSLADFALDVIPKIGTLMLPGNAEDQNGTKGKLTRAGLYSANALKVFLGVKLTLIIGLSAAFALAPYLAGFLDLMWAMVASCVASGVGLIGPNLWLEWQINRRQRELRRSLPDALDMLVLCLEGGLTLSAAVQRITDELQEVHPILGEEMKIVQQTSQLGMSTGDALKKFGERSDLEEVRELAAVLLQSERFGASVVKALKAHADQFREDRQARAEEMAHKAAVKIIFPMLLFIFPAIFVVLLGPAAFHFTNLFAK